MADGKVSEHTRYAAFTKPQAPYRIRFFTVLVLTGLLVSFFADLYLESTYSPLQRYSKPVFAFFALAGCLELLWVIVKESRAGNLPASEPLERFLARYRWHTQPAAEYSMDYVATFLLARSWSKRIMAQYAGSYKGYPLHAVKYEYIQDPELIRHREDWLPATSIRFQLPQEFPFIEVVRRSFTELYMDAPMVKPYGETMKLEGNFSRLFDVTILPGTEMEALTFLTPDFMAELADTLYDFSFEIGGNGLYVYSDMGGNAPVGDTVRELHNLLGGADALFKHIHELSDSWNATTSHKAIRQLRRQVLQNRERVADKAEHRDLPAQPNGPDLFSFDR